MQEEPRIRRVHIPKQIGNVRVMSTYNVDHRIEMSGFKRLISILFLLNNPGRSSLLLALSDLESTPLTYDTAKCIG